MRRYSSLLFALVLALSHGACSDGSGPTGPDTSRMEILILGGGGQFGLGGELLPEPLSVRVQSLSTGSGEEGVNVSWEVVEGQGASLDFRTTVTDSVGATSVRLTLGEGKGDYRVRARVKGMTSPPVEFLARVIDTPELTSVPDTPVQAGGIMALGGLNFSPVPAENVVTFSGIRGRVLTASVDELQVEVPPCLPTREVQLRVQIGALSTDSMGVAVLGGDEFLDLQVGEDRILDASEALACVRLPSSTEGSYLVVPHATGTVGGAVYPLTITGLTEDGLPPTAPAPPQVGRLPGRSPSAGSAPEGVPDAHWAWEGQLRALERILVKEWRDKVGRSSLTAPSPGVPDRIPEVGEERQFKVLNSDNEFDDITARVALVTEHSLIYVDQEAPAGGFTSGDLLSFAQQFEDPIYPTVTDVFGGESDLDGNGRIIILFTPGVNRLTQADAGGYVGGFFFGLDLYPGREGSNGGEIFYAVVPDPTGIHGPMLSRALLASSLPAILAHEFEHMVHFNQRILVREAESQEALWLSEALAQMAEDLVGQAFRQMGSLTKALEFQSGNWRRAERFLEDPSQVSVLAALPPGTLAERGAGWLLLRHLFGREGEVDLLRALVGSERVGVGNVTATIGRNWPDIVTDWAGSNYLDGLAVPVRPGLETLGINLREALSSSQDPYPLQPPTVGDSSFSISGSLWSSAPDYYILTPPATGGVAVHVGGAGGRPAGTAAGMRILVVRLQ